MAVSVISVAGAGASNTESTEYTGFSLNGYNITDSGMTHVYICGKICCFSINIMKTSGATLSDTQVLVNNMPIPKEEKIIDILSYNGTSCERYKGKINSSGQITNWYSGMKTYANNPSMLFGNYVIE